MPYPKVKLEKIGDTDKLYQELLLKADIGPLWLLAAMAFAFFLVYPYR